MTPSQENCLFDAHRWTRERWGEEHGFTVKKTSKRLLLAALMMGCSFGAVHDAFAEEAARTPAEAEDSQRTAQENADSEYQLPDLTVLGDRKTFRGGMIERKSATGILGGKDSLELPFSVTTVSQKAIETFSTPQSGVMDTLSLVPSVRASSSKSVHSVTIRGFQQNGYSMYINGIPGAMSSGNLPYYWIENATVVAGPNLGVNGTNISDTIAAQSTSSRRGRKPRTIQMYASPITAADRSSKASMSVGASVRTRRSDCASRPTTSAAKRCRKTRNSSRTTSS